jgi:hypothetical protein
MKIMKTKIFILTAMPLLITLAGCQGPRENGDSQGPIESRNPRSAIHGDVGVEMESRNMSNVAPTTRPNI